MYISIKDPYVLEASDHIKISFSTGLYAVPVGSLCTTSWVGRTIYFKEMLSEKYMASYILKLSEKDGLQESAFFWYENTLQPLALAPKPSHARSYPLLQKGGEIWL